MNINSKDFVGDCPMTVENAKKYDITEEIEKTFCSLGCSVKCSELLVARIQHTRKGGK